MSSPESELAAPRPPKSPAEAFRQFVELTATEDSLLNTETETYFRLLEPFLLDRRYREHVEMIARAALLPKDAAKLASFGMRLTGQCDLFKGVGEDAAARYKELLDDLELGEVGIRFITPVIRQDNRAEWVPANQAYLLTASIDVNPSEGLIPDQLSVRIEIDPTAGAQVLDEFPKRETEVSAAEVREGGFVQSSTDQLSAGVNAKAEGLGVSFGAKTSDSVEESEKITVSRDLIKHRINSGTGDSYARWQMFGSDRHSLLGGNLFYALVLAPAEASSLKAKASVLVEFKGYGETRAETDPDEELALPGPAMTAK